MYEEKNFSTGSLVLALLVGGVVGAGIALLTAPRSGKETREKIKSLTDEAKGKIVSYTEEAKMKIADTLSKGKDIVQEKRHLVSGAIEAGRKAMEEEKQRLAGG